MKFIECLKKENNFSEIVELIPRKISNFSRIFPGLERFTLKYFKTQSSINDKRISIPGFCYSDEFSFFIKDVLADKLKY